MSESIDVRVKKATVKAALVTEAGVRLGGRAVVTGTVTSAKVVGAVAKGVVHGLGGAGWMARARAAFDEEIKRIESSR